MAELNLDFYKGTDGYSDGDVEDRLLDLVREENRREETAQDGGQDLRSAGMSADTVPTGGKQFSGAQKGLSQSGTAARDRDERILQAALAEAQSREDVWPIIYHLSPVRENILSWYPFKKNASILEIGAGPGAITGLLCRRLSRVTSVELSKRRAEINFERHRSYGNLTVMVGNLNDMTFAEKFDYISLNGVFEYAMSFTEGPEPYLTFLRKCLSLLKGDGILLTAIENRLGLKYLAGAPEDHTLRYMDSLKDYPGNESVRTFSKAEWLSLMDACGVRCRRFYYPYPDYKFPEEIYTDESINDCGGSAQARPYGHESWNFTPDRFELFPEEKAAALLAGEGILDRFANSFLIEMSRKPLPACDGPAYIRLAEDGEAQIMPGGVPAPRSGSRKPSDIRRWSIPSVPYDLGEERLRRHPKPLTGRLYVDLGEGFSEENAIAAAPVLSEGDRYEIGFNLAGWLASHLAGADGRQLLSRVRALRFDPLEGCLCEAKLSASGGKLTAQNAAAEENGEALFLTEDPNYLLETGGSVPAEIAISGKLKVHDRSWGLQKAQELLQSAKRPAWKRLFH